LSINIKMNVIFITIKYMTSYLILRDWIDIRYKKSAF